jgi:hypothetical protein
MLPNAKQRKILQLIRDGREAYCICNTIHIRLSQDEISSGRQTNTQVHISLEELWAMKEAHWIELVKVTKDCARCKYACFFFEPSFTVPQHWHQMPYRITPIGYAFVDRASIIGPEALNDHDAHPAERRE